LPGSILINRLAQGDPSALGEIYDRYAGIVHALALRMLRDAGDAEDLVQAVFLQARREAARYDLRGGPPMAWLCAMARELAFARLYGLPRTAASAGQRSVRALGYYEGLTPADLSEQFGAPNGAIGDRARSSTMLHAAQ
jgi:DNA-directed RNA polymerase specialized sigma24 family protein